MVAGVASAPFQDPIVHLLFGQLVFNPFQEACPPGWIRSGLHPGCSRPATDRTIQLRKPAFAALFRGLPGVSTSLWMFFWLMLLFGMYFSRKLYRLIPTRYPASFWLNVATTMLIPLGPAVEDSDSGKDVYAALVVRTGLFVAVTLYAWLAVSVLEYLCMRRIRRVASLSPDMETPAC